MSAHHGDKFVDHKLSCVVIISLFVVTLGVFSQILKSAFIPYDDDEYVYENEIVRRGLSRDGVVWAFSTTHAANWHPMTWLSHMLDMQLFGLNASWHHLVNVLFHAANTIVLFLVLWRMTRALWQSGCVALLFAIHPLHVESVAWVAERKDVLSTFFLMLTFLAYVRYTEEPKFKRYILLVTFFILGLMSKPMLVTVPFILLLLDYWPLRRLSFSSLQPNLPQQKFASMSVQSLLLEKLPLFLLSGASCVITYIAQWDALAPTTRIPFAGRVANAVLAYARYIGKMLWPMSLSAYYPYDIASVPPWKLWGAVVVLSSLTIVAVGMAKSRPYATVGWLWYLGTLIPVIGLVQVGGQAMADRYTYVPLIGVFVLLVWGFDDLRSRWHFPQYLAIPFLAILFSSLGLTTWFQVEHWRNGIELFSHSLQVTKNNGLANLNLGKALFDEGRYVEAIPFFREAVQIMPDYSLAFSNLGITLGRVGKLEEAIEYSRRAQKMNPKDAGAYLGLGYALIRQGRIEEAINAYRSAYQIASYPASSLTNVGVDLAQEGRVVESAAIFREAIRMDRNDAYANYNLGYALLLQGKADEALPFLKEAVRLNPGDPQMPRKLDEALTKMKQQ
jgi:tetratricopeptide (TPR) repeat protein